MILVSACLVRINCKYSGGNNFNQKIFDLVKEGNVSSTRGFIIYRSKFKKKNKKILKKIKKKCIILIYKK